MALDNNIVSGIIKTTHAHNLHVKMLDFVPFTFVQFVRERKGCKLFTRKFAQKNFKKSPRLYNICN